MIDLLNNGGFQSFSCKFIDCRKLFWPLIEAARNQWKYFSFLHESLGLNSIEEKEMISRIEEEQEESKYREVTSVIKIAIKRRPI